MKELTKLIFEKLGVEPNEEFYIKVNGKKRDELFRISNNLIVWYKEEDIWLESSWTINYFISGEVEIIKNLITEEDKKWLLGAVIIIMYLMNYYKKKINEEVNKNNV